MLRFDTHLVCERCGKESEPLPGKPYMYERFAVAKDLTTYPDGWSIIATINPPNIYHFCCEDHKAEWGKHYERQQKKVRRGNAA